MKSDFFKRTMIMGLALCVMPLGVVAHAEDDPGATPAGWSEGEKTGWEGATPHIRQKTEDVAGQMGQEADNETALRMKPAAKLDKKAQKEAVKKEREAMRKAERAKKEAEKKAREVARKAEKAQKEAAWKAKEAKRKQEREQREAERKARLSKKKTGL